MQKQNKRIVSIGDLHFGTGVPIIQTMTTTSTKDIDNTIKQINEVAKAGAQLVRVAVEDYEDAYAIRHIREKITIPIVADIHFDGNLALAAIESGVDKLRLNPGNIKDKEKVKEIVKACQSKHIPIRIGVNSASMSKDIIEKYGISKDGIIAQADREIKLFEELGFTDIILSLKTSDPLLTLECYQEANKLWNYPLHLGLTEAGTIERGLLRSGFVLGSLLSQGIGETIRISLTADPIKEVIACKNLLSMFYKIDHPTVISCPTCGRCHYPLADLIEKLDPLINTLNIPIKIAIMGCVVNGPGEAKDADIGLAGGDGYVALFKKGKFIRKIEQANILSEFSKELDELNINHKKS